jgi:phosphate transport system substrate-binding protein
VRKLPTIDVRMGCTLGGIALLGAGIAGLTYASAGASDPRELARRNPPPVIRPAPYVVKLETVEQIGYEATKQLAPAPMAEALPATRTEQPKIDTLTVVVGRNAQRSFDNKLEAAYEAELVNQQIKTITSSDREAIELLMMGRAEFGLIGGSLSQREVHAGLRQTQIGVELFALAVSPMSPVSSITHAQVRQIFTGQVTDWYQLGYDACPIVAIIPNDSDRSLRAARTMFPGDSFSSECLRVNDDQRVAEQILRNRGGIGIVQVTSQALAPGMKLIQVDWTQPTPEAFGYGTYKYGIPLQLVTSGQPDQKALDFLFFANSARGRELLGRNLVFAR